MKAQPYTALRLEILELEAQYTALSCEYQTRLFNLAYFLNSHMVEAILKQPEKLAEVEQANLELLAKLNELRSVIRLKMQHLIFLLELQQRLRERLN